MSSPEFTFEIEQLDVGFIVTGDVYDTTIRVAAASRDEAIEAAVERAQNRYEDSQRAAGQTWSGSLRIVRITLSTRQELDR
jgi:hypothetical protein